MEDWTKRFALAALVGFFAGLFALPVACGGFVLRNEHVYGDVQSGGPEAVLKAMGVAAVAGICVAWFVWRKARPSEHAAERDTRELSQRVPRGRERTPREW